MDEEYFEWLSLLRAVKHKLSQPRNSPFVVAELGARYGTWTVRAGAAMRILQPFRPVQLLAVEADQSGFKWLQDHVRLNGLGHATQAIRGFVSDNKAQIEFQPWERDSKADSVPSFTLHELLSSYDHVDIIHCDIQGWERIFPDSMELLSSKVAAIHFGTHNSEVHTRLRDAFLRGGWRVTQDIIGNGGKMPGRVEDTAYGAIRILWDGVLAVENPRPLTAWSQRVHAQQQSDE